MENKHTPMNGYSIRYLVKKNGGCYQFTTIQAVIDTMNLIEPVDFMQNKDFYLYMYVEYNDLAEKFKFSDTICILHASKTEKDTIELTSQVFNSICTDHVSILEFKAVIDYVMKEINIDNFESLQILYAIERDIRNQREYIYDAEQNVQKKLSLYNEKDIEIQKEIKKYVTGAIE